jgi:hypothetical protein
MATVSLWSNVAVAVQSALGTENTVTSVTKANPAVVTYTGADPSNGEYLVMSSQGMHQIDARVFRVANVNAGSNTLELEGENTTAYDTFVSGSFQVITFGTTIATISGLTASGGDFEFIDATTIHDAVRKQVPGAASPAVFNMESIWDVADAGLVALKTASDNKAIRAIRYTFSNAQKLLFNGYVGCTLLPTGSAQDKVITPVSITMFGRPTVYSS